MLEITDLKKEFRDVKAVDGVSFSIAQGCCFGLLGPNGAGKTTTVEMLEGIIAPTSGEIRYKNRPLGSHFRNEVGIMFQHTALQEFITVREILTLFKNFYEQSKPIEELVKNCALEEFLDRDTRNLSGGQRQRLLLAIALINDPNIIFLDEPTTGLDPQSRRNFWDLLKKLKSQKKTIILTTHYMEEAHELCDELAIMDHGRIIAQGTPRALLAEHFNSAIITLPADDIPDAVREIDGSEVVRTENRAEILSRHIEQTIQSLIAQQIPLNRLQVRSRTLEDLFIKLTGHELRT
ncbi:MAG: ABC transporter ATP-binding protein [Candidatus Polarisedimenticolaceae bacterium]|nr:ABC transporter ATP-binding protein [Candidatus Polarisedimenticolaceae bacterium]